MIFKKEIELSLHKERQITPSDLKQLYDELEWWPDRQEEDIKRTLNLGLAVGAWKYNRLIGFCRAVSDGIFRAYIEDVAVIAPFRKQGIGKEMVNRMMEELSHIHVVSLFCEEGLECFYNESQFKRTSQIVMHCKKRV